MNIDSIKIRFPIACLSDFDATAFETSRKNSIQFEGTKIEHKLIAKKPLGLKDIYLNESKGHGTLEMSAKILKENYFKLINLNTIENVFENVNASGLIRLDPNNVIENSDVLRCDVTTDLHTKDIKQHLRSLSVFRLNQKYECKMFPSSIVFNRNVTTKGLKEYQTFYCKETDMKKKDAELLKYVSIGKAKNVLRCESRYANFQQLRTAFETTDLSLLSILQSEANPNLKLFNRITQDIEPSDYTNIQTYKKLIEMKETNYHKDVRNEIGDFSILSMCNCDIELVKVYLATNSTANNSRLLRRFKSRLKAKNDFENTITDSNIDEIRTLLNAA